MEILPVVSMMTAEEDSHASSRNGQAQAACSPNTVVKGALEMRYLFFAPVVGDRLQHGI